MKQLRVSIFLLFIHNKEIMKVIWFQFLSVVNKSFGVNIHLTHLAETILMSTYCPISLTLPVDPHTLISLFQIGNIILHKLNQTSHVHALYLYIVTKRPETLVV